MSRDGDGESLQDCVSHVGGLDVYLTSNNLSNSIYSHCCHCIKNVMKWVMGSRVEAETVGRTCCHSNQVRKSIHQD